MSVLKLKALLATAGATVILASAQAQETLGHATAAPSQPPESTNDAAPQKSDSGNPDETTENSDDMADTLNSQQQLQQTFVLERRVNGQVVETEKRTVTYDRNMPYRETEAGKSALESLKEKFDGELLTRVEAFEEAKLDFTIADIDRDGLLTEQEFADLVDSWRENETRQAEAPTREIARQRQYDAFLFELNPDAGEIQNEAFAKQKFKFMSGAQEFMSREDYIREYLLDFDSMDADKDSLLKDAELMRFRALNRGETI